VTVTIASPAPPGRWTCALSLARFAVRLVLRPSTPVPSPRLNVPVPPGPRAARVEALSGIADGLGVTEARRGGMTVAELRVGCLMVEAHLLADDFTRQIAGMPAFDDMAAAARSWEANLVPGGSA